MRSHLFHMLIYASVVATFFAVLLHRERRAQLRLGGILWGSMIGGAFVLAYLMSSYPG